MQIVARRGDSSSLMFAVRTKVSLLRLRRILLGAPKAKWPSAVLPHLDSAVFATSGVELSIWGESDAPDWTVVSLVNLCDMVSSCNWHAGEISLTHLTVGLKVVDLGPGIIASTNNVLALLRVHSNTGDWVWHLNLLDESASIKSTVEVDLVSGRNCKHWITSTNVRGVGANLKLVELD